MYRKFFFITIFFITGTLLTIYLSDYLLDLIIVLLITYFIILAISYFLKDKFFSKSSIFIILGIILTNIVFKSRIYNYIEEQTKVIGIVNNINIDEGVVKNYEIICKSINGNKLFCNNKILLTIENKEKLNLGERIKFNVKFKIPMTYKNHKLFNYKNYLLSKKIYATGYVKSVEKLNNEKNFNYKIRIWFNTRVDKSLDRVLLDKNKKLLKSIIMGENYLDFNDRVAYRQLGLAHVLAVSGLHIGIIASFINIVMTKVAFNKNSSRMTTIGVLWLYGYLIGFPVSILRANIMISTYYLSKNLKCPYDYKNSIFLSMFLILLINPLYIYNQSFILSFASVLSIAYINPFIEMKIKKISVVYGGIISPILAVNIGIIPILAYYYNTVQIGYIVANLLVVPIIAIVLNLSFITILLGGSYLVNFIINTLLLSQIGLISLLIKLPHFEFTIFSPDIEEIIMYYILIFIVIYSKKFRKIYYDYRFVLYFSIIYVIFSTVYELKVLDKLELSFIDVGQGDFMVFKYRGKNYIIDTGGEVFGEYSIGENVVVPYLIKNNLTNIEILFISHFHEDHSKAGIDICKELNVKNVFASYSIDNYIYNYINEINVINILTRGDRLKLGKNFNLSILSPKEEYIDKKISENDLSLVILMSFKNFKALFTGDIEKKIETELLKDGLESVDLLKVPHHGSKTSSNIEFLQKLNPSMSIFNVGKNNRFNHPNKEVLNRYENLKTVIFRTDLDGEINIVIKNDKLYFKRYIDSYRINFINIIYYAIYTLILLKYFNNRRLSMLLYNDYGRECVWIF